MTLKNEFFDNHETAVLGRMSHFSISAVMATILSGSPVLCLDAKNEMSFDQISELQIEVLIGKGLFCSQSK